MPRASKKLGVGCRVSLRAVSLAPALARELCGAEFAEARLSGAVTRITDVGLSVRVEPSGRIVDLRGGQVKYEGPAVAEDVVVEVPPAVPVFDDPDGAAAAVAAPAEPQDTSDSEDEAAVEQAEDPAAAGPAEPAVSPWIFRPVSVDQREVTPSYRRATEVNIDNPGSADELDYFMAFFPHRYVSNVVLGSINERGRTMSAAWRDIDLPEYLSFLGLWLTMTLCPLPDRSLYWRRDAAKMSPLPVFNFHVHMSMQRFDEIVSNHCLESRHAEVEGDIQHGVRSFLDAFNAQLARAVTPGQYICIDESMERWLGRVNKMPGRRKTPNKPIPVGQEHKDCADAATNIMLRLELSEEKERDALKEFTREHGATAACCLRLTRPWWRSGRTVIGDSWFGSPKACLQLAHMGLFSIMSCKKRAAWPRDYPGVALMEALNVDYGSVVSASRDVDRWHLLAAALRDRKPRCIIASCSTTNLGDEVTHVMKERGRSFNATFHVPLVFQDYTRAKGAVDINNNIRDNMTSWSDVMRVDKCELRTFAFYLGVMEANAFLACRAFRTDYKAARVTHVAFRQRLAMQMLQYRDRVMRRLVPQPLVGFSLCRFPAFGEDGSLTQQYVQRRCRHCGARTSRHCSCDGATAVCIKCFFAHIQQCHVNSA